MTTLAQANTSTNESHSGHTTFETETVNDKHTAKFDVALGLPPADTTLGSEYYTQYIKEVIRTGNTPF